ncbi:hypothetical protein CVT26_000444 [Gymnopilus dilepis]|uniref:Uncharacterized protein n=1 Tax=Gymnopilus dilepis TaxID=231916 RepID=A0A409WKZ7_9AGAR|nr:hypothetical protein CVT26_000444 [Gymnopilus dilepis]
MSTQDIIAYPDVMPAKQSQSLPRLDRGMKPVLVLEGKASITTGGSSGTGRATVVMFAREGASRIGTTHLPEEIDGAKGANCNSADVDLRTTTVDYSSTTGAVVPFACSLAVQLMPKGIRVNAVAPGAVCTVRQSGSRSPESVEGWGLGTAGQPIDCGPNSVFLASSCDSNISTGQVVLVNSGMHVGGSNHRRGPGQSHRKGRKELLARSQYRNDRGKITLLAMNNSIYSVRRRPKDVHLRNK